MTLNEKELAQIRKQVAKKPYLKHWLETYELQKKYNDTQSDEARMKRITSFEDACAELKLNPDKIKSSMRAHEVAFEKLTIIIKALDGKKYNQLSGENMERWYPIFYRRKNGAMIIFKESALVEDEALTAANTPLLTLKNKMLSDYCGRQFLDLWRQYLI